MPLPVSSISGLQDIFQRLLESFQSILSRASAFLICRPHVSRELFEVLVEIIQLRLNSFVDLIEP
jgi:hypothetical protein